MTPVIAALEAATEGSREDDLTLADYASIGAAADALASAFEDEHGMDPLAAHETAAEALTVMIACGWTITAPEAALRTRAAG